MTDDDPRPPLVLRRTNRALVILVPLALVGNMVVRTGSLAAVPGALIFSAGVTGGLLCAEWLVVRARKQVPALPFFERASHGQRPWVAMGIAAILVMAAREHVCGLSGVEYEDWHAETSEQRSVHTNVFSEAVNGDPPSFAGRPVSCNASCSLGRSDLCDAALARIRCDSHEPNAVRVSIYITPTNVGCSLVPWFHDAHVAYTANGSIEAYDEHGHKTLSFDISGSIERHATGFHSCVAFDTAIGAQIGEEIVEAIEPMLDDDGG
jgi:hypothetical protein